jgi:hypothetical protein
MGEFVPDVDIDFADRDLALSEVFHIPASRYDPNKKDLMRHNVGVYFQNIPRDPLTQLASIPYEEAEELGYFKVDFLNLAIYKSVRDEAHLQELMDREPMWEMLEVQEISDQLFQLGGVIDGIPTHELLGAYKPKSVMELAMFLALIRPRKKHLIGLEWADVEADIWTPGDDSLYGFKKGHAVSYAHVVIMQMNLLVEQTQ